MIKVIMKCTQCNWELITLITNMGDWANLDEANWEKSKHVSDFNHIVRIKQETVYSIRRN